MSEVITLSSDEEEPAKKKRKTGKSKSAADKASNNDLVILTDDENDIAIVEEDRDPLSDEAVQKAKEIDKNGNKSTENNDVDDLAELNEEIGDLSLHTNDALFSKFLGTILKAVSSQHEQLLHSKISIIKKLYKHSLHYGSTEEFKNMLQKNIDRVQEAAGECLLCFNGVFEALKFEYSCVKDAPETSSSTDRKIKKLDSILLKLRKKIRELENAEIGGSDLEDEESEYIKLQRYKERAVKVFGKLCTYVNEDPYHSHLTHRKLNFSKSKYPEFNKIINKKYKNNSVFPTYYEMEKLLQKCIRVHDMDISAAEAKVEIRRCFEELGNLLQKRRKTDLFLTHNDYLTDRPDPAADDPELLTTLKSNKKEAETNLDNIITEFSIKQEKGEEPELSEDTDDSQHKESENEEND